MADPAPASEYPGAVDYIGRSYSLRRAPYAAPAPARASDEAEDAGLAGGPDEDSAAEESASEGGDGESGDEGSDREGAAALSDEEAAGAAQPPEGDADDRLARRRARANARRQKRPGVPAPLRRELHEDMEEAEGREWWGRREA